MSGKFVRASKYRHVFGQPSKKELYYENLKVTKNAWDSNIIHSNGKFISVNWDSSGGGAFAIIPVNEVGKAPDTVSLFRGHKGPVLDTAFNPFNQQEVASCSDDGNISIWKIPEDYSFHKYIDENEQVKDITVPVQVLLGHTKKVGLIEYHPCAEDVLASSSLDYTVKIWNLKTGKDEITLQHKDLVTSFAFNYNGSLLATTSRDKKLRIWDIRKGVIISEGAGHTGAKPSRVTWLGNTDRVVTTGFSRLSDRQIGIWDIHNIEKGPIDGFLVIDSSSGVLIPFFDNETSMLYLAGRGDGNIRYYEYENDILYELSQYASTDPQRGFAVAPKHSVNVKENEVVKAFKTVSDNSIEPISFIVPRRSELFQSDIYPDCPSTTPALSAEEWFGGKVVNGPILMTMEAVFEGKEPTLKESKVSSTVPAKKQSSETEKEKETSPAKKAEEKEKEKKKETKTGLAKESKDDVVKTNSTIKQNVDDLLKNSNEVGNLLNRVVDLSDDENPDQTPYDNEEDWEEVEKADLKSGSPSKHKESKEDDDDDLNLELEKKDESASPKDKEKEQKKKTSEETEATDITESKEKGESIANKESTDKSTSTVEAENLKSSTQGEAETSTKIDSPVSNPDTLTKENEPSTKIDSPVSNPDTLTKENEPSKSQSAAIINDGQNGVKPKPTLVSTVEKLATLVTQLETQISILQNSALEKNERLKALERKIDSLLK
ncbi:CRN1 [Candida oxycetoniae]|uniref:Coronin n=1 Tax=Candida oxycetoniae TaxID=497107 RepID=A0AAI9T095_9ASCO|nr:CRN1 [Candida oxycetoniae]KAI3406478.2 CRN1 [Candida oxycetoniae]